MEHRIKKAMSYGTWERRVEVISCALSGTTNDMNYAFLTATMAYFEAVDSNDYERAEAFRRMRKHLMQGSLSGVAKTLDELEKLNSER